MFVEPTHNPDKNVAAPIAKYRMKENKSNVWDGTCRLVVSIQTA